MEVREGNSHVGKDKKLVLLVVDSLLVGGATEGLNNFKTDMSRYARILLPLVSKLVITKSNRLISVKEKQETPKETLGVKEH